MITQKQYNEMLDSFNDEDWKNIRRRMEREVTRNKLWTEDLFRKYCSAVVRSGFQKGRVKLMNRSQSLKLHLDSNFYPPLPESFKFKFVEVFEKYWGCR